MFQLLSIYRYFAFMIAVGLMLAAPPLRGQTPSPETYLVLGLVGGYVILRVFLPYYPQPGSLIGYLSLGLDVAVALGSVLATGGLDSGLLLYSLAPVLTAALLLEERVAWSVAGVASLGLLAPHLAHSHFSWILSGNYLVLFLVYAIASAMVAIVPYRTNLNIRRRLVQTAIVEERRRLQREIHDSLAQDVGFLNLKAKQIQESLASSPPQALSQELANLQEAIQNTYMNIREYLDALSLPGSSALVPALRELGREFIARSGIGLEAELPQEGTGLSPVEEMHLLRIAQEALSNVRRHSGARRAWLSLSRASRAVELVVRDDGQGFVPDEAAPHGHYGLQGMQERAREIDATLSIVSAPGQGTQVRVRLPR